jgi:hypothetical protein
LATCFGAIWSSAGSGGATNSYPLLLNAVLGTRFKVVSGYAGTAEGTSPWSAARSRVSADHLGEREGDEAEALRDKNLRILVQYGLTKHKELPDVPWVFDYAKNDADRAALRCC